MTAHRRVLLDCDPGIDDAFALFCATRFADLAVVTTVSGNVQIEHTTRNALHLLELIGADVPVHSGAEAPLVVAPTFAGHVQGAAGLGASVTPKPLRDAEATSATEAIIEFCVDGDANIVATGPLTNLALAVREDPSIAGRIARLHWMGGSTESGNVTPRAEFNAWADPHAVDVVFTSGIPLTMYGLNLTRQVRMGEAHITILEEAATSTSVPASQFLRFYLDNGEKDGLGQPMHDPCAVLGLTHPELFTVAPSSIVAHADGEQRGMTEETDPIGPSDHHVARVAVAPTVIDLIIEAAINPARAR